MHVEGSPIFDAVEPSARPSGVVTLVSIRPKYTGCFPSEQLTRADAFGGLVGLAMLTKARAKNDWHYPAEVANLMMHEYSPETDGAVGTVGTVGTVGAPLASVVSTRMLGDKVGAVTPPTIGPSAGRGAVTGSMRGPLVMLATK